MKFIKSFIVVLVIALVCMLGFTGANKISHAMHEAAQTGEKVANAIDKAAHAGEHVAHAIHKGSNFVDHAANAIDHMHG